ncbi:aldose epimerase family protein [Vibrio variabilis]|uniref:aldose epimerase family protein n=1 Tax=Vibrio variabilis TaxID=990271 RepID=UPI000DD80029|nr:aldose epimerase family protein [Vibrio variabilis]
MNANTGKSPRQWGQYNLYSLSNGNGTQIDISDLGATIINFFVTTEAGKRNNIVLGYDNPEDYLQGSVYLGGVIGPWANRIQSGRYLAGGKHIQLETNEDANHLHGGKANVAKKRWHTTYQSVDSIEFSVSVNKGESGHPAAIDFRVRYQLNENNELSIVYSAFPHAPTAINMTQHAYFNLDGTANIYEHQVQINAQHYLETDHSGIPVEVKNVTGTAMDFRQPRLIKDAMTQLSEQSLSNLGFDHCWCLPATPMYHAAKVTSRRSGITLDVYTDQGGLQFYTAGYLNNELGRKGNSYQQHAGLCLETQCYPNQVNMPDTPNCIFDINNPYHQVTMFKISMANTSTRY